MSGTVAGDPSRKMPAGVWVLGFVSLFMDVSSEMVHCPWTGRRRPGQNWPIAAADGMQARQPISPRSGVSPVAI